MKAKGKKSFILRVGIIRFGGFMFVVMTGLDLLRKPPFPREVIDYAFDITISLLIWPLAGYPQIIGETSPFHQLLCPDARFQVVGEIACFDN